MKKKILIGVLTMLVACCLGAGCRDAAESYEYDYDYTYTFHCGYVSEETDEGMSIDGVLSESVWKKQNWFSNTKYGSTVRTATYFTEKGLYIASVVTDNMIYYNNGYNFNADSCVDYHIIDENVKKYDFKNYTRVAVNCAGEVYRYTPCVVLADATVQGNAVNTGSSEGMTVELFIEWSQMGLKEMPNHVGIVPRYYRVTSYGTNVTGTWVYASRGSLANINSYYQFNANGYMQTDEEDAFFGDSAVGAAKTNGWDLSAYDTRNRVSSTVEYDQYLFIREAYSSRYAFSVLATSNGAIVNTTPMFGVLSGYLNETGYFSSFLIDGRADYLTKNRVQCKTRVVNAANANTFGNVLYDDFGEGGANFQRGVKITVIKDLETFYYLINDEVVAVEEIAALRGKTSCGLFSLNSSAVFGKCTYTDYENDEEGFAAFLGRYACKLSVREGIIGGSVTLNAAGVAKGGDAVLTISNQTGYRLKSITAGGEDITELCNTEMQRGKFTIHNITQSLEIDATFEPAVGYSVEGNVDIQGETARKKTGIVVTAEDVSAHTAVYTATPSSTGRYALRLPAGTYRIFYELEGCRTAEQLVTVDGDATLADAVVTVRRVGGSANGMNSLNEWDYSREDEGYVTTGSSLAESYIMFTETSLEHYMLHATISDVGKGDDNPGAGFIVAADGYSGLAIMLINNGIRVMPVGKFSQRINYNNLGSYSVTRSEIQLTVIREGTTYFVYVDGVFVLSMENSLIAGEAGIGLYKYGNTEIAFADYGYTTDEEEIGSYMREHGNN